MSNKKKKYLDEVKAISKDKTIGTYAPKATEINGIPTHTIPVVEIVAESPYKLTDYQKAQASKIKDNFRRGQYLKESQEYNKSIKSSLKKKGLVNTYKPTILPNEARILLANRGKSKEEIDRLSDEDASHLAEFLNAYDNIGKKIGIPSSQLMIAPFLLNNMSLTQLNRLNGIVDAAKTGYGMYDLMVNRNPINPKELMFDMLGGAASMYLDQKLPAWLSGLARKYDYKINKKIQNAKIKDWEEYINKQDLNARQKRNLEIIKNNNLIYNSGYGYPAYLPTIEELDVDDYILKENLIKQFYNPHNTYVRGVGLGKAENKNLVIKQLLDQNIQPTNENIAKYMATVIPPKSTGGARYGSFGNDAIYTSNSVGTAKTYARDYGDPYYAKVKRKYSLSEDPTKWASEADYVFGDLGMYNYNLKTLKRKLNKRIYKNPFILKNVIKNHNVSKQNTPFTTGVETSKYNPYNHFAFSGIAGDSPLEFIEFVEPTKFDKGGFNWGFVNEGLSRKNFKLGGKLNVK